MSDLYTSQVHLKRLLAGQATPAFTPAPEAVLKMLDPAFFPGMGALDADAEGRRRCPLRGCGSYHHSLGKHLADHHRHTVNAVGLKRLLGIPKNTSLLSPSARRAVCAGSVGKGTPGGPSKYGRPRRNGTNNGSPMQKNFSDTCPAQLRAKLISLRDELGHSPTMSDFKAKFGDSVSMAVQRTFGSFNAAKATCALEQYAYGSIPPHNQITGALVVESFRGWVETHGDLPGAREIRDRSAAPRVVSAATAKRALGVNNWGAAMRSVGESLGIKSERYGFDFRKRAA